MTSKDIAKLAGVSQTSVSLVVRNKWQGRMSEKVAKHIQEVCDANGYKPNYAASLLKKGKSNTIAMVVPTSENPFYGSLLHSLRSEMEKRGAICLLIETDNNPRWYEYIEDSILGGQIFAAIILYTNLPKRNPLIEKNIIYIDDDDIGTNSIAIDFQDAIKEAVSLLKEKYPFMMHVHLDIKKTTFFNRAKAFDDACNSLGIFHGRISTTNLSKEKDIYDHLVAIEKTLVYPMAFILDDDLLASSIYRFFNERNKIIGKDVGIVSLDNTFVCHCFYPWLSSFDYNREEMLHAIFDTLDLIENNEIKTEQTILKMKLNNGKSF